ncbi:PRC-barrel domain-containing protein [Parvularcula marina]|uniref:PRC-barrel domain-containing protein n=1 Tax=Parvularcula marina TaxID=2292771 RepID=UPI0035197B10
MKLHSLTALLLISSSTALAACDETEASVADDTVVIEETVAATDTVAVIDEPDFIGLTVTDADDVNIGIVDDVIATADHGELLVIRIDLADGPTFRALNVDEFETDGADEGLVISHLTKEEVISLPEFFPSADVHEDEDSLGHNG